MKGLRLSDEEVERMIGKSNCDRSVEAHVASGKCYGCARVRFCLWTDASDGEYVPVVLCLECIARFLYEK